MQKVILIKITSSTDELQLQMTGYPVRLYVLDGVNGCYEKNTCAYEFLDPSQLGH